MTVYLVGAGPGDPGLLTVRAAELIARADVILHDRLIPAEALAGARPDAEVVYVGKQGGGPQMPQEEIHRLLLEHARAGREVVRLKGGDPFVFGRGGEEALVCLEAGIPFEVVPGITAGVAAPAYAGIPVTHRELASGVAFVTGHEDPAKPETALDWPALAAFPGTLVFYMGVRSLPRIAEQLVAGGRPASEPVAVVERGTLPGQRTLLATLADVGATRGRRRASARRRSRSSGRWRRCASSSRWLERRPLHGVSVAVTRARPQASGLAARLRELGATVVEAPAIRIEPLAPDAAGPRRVRPRLRHVAERRARAVRAARRGGPGRAGAGRRDGGGDRAGHRAGARRARDPRRPACRTARSPRASSRRSGSVAVRRALVVRAREGRDVLPDALRERGAEVELLALYETVAEPLDGATAEAAAAADYVTFTSASTVRFFLAAAGALDGPRIASIGPATSAALREAGIEPGPGGRPAHAGRPRRRAGRRRRRPRPGVGSAARAPDHVPLRLRHGRRVRRRRARGDRAPGARRRG